MDWCGEFKAAVQLHAAVGVGAIAFGGERQLGALGVDELVVVHAVVMLFVLAGWEQAAHAELLAHGRLGIAGGAQQRLRAATAFLHQAHAGGERFAAGLDLHMRGAIGGARWWYLRLYAEAGDAAHQRGVALERLAGQRALSQELCASLST